MDYKKLYLEQKIQSMRMELEMLQMRFVQVKEELPLIVKELEEYSKEKKQEK